MQMKKKNANEKFFKKMLFRKIQCNKANSTASILIELQQTTTERCLFLPN
jgi:hypothetical protein